MTLRALAGTLKIPGAAVRRAWAGYRAPEKFKAFDDLKGLDPGLRRDLEELLWLEKKYRIHMFQLAGLTGAGSGVATSMYMVSRADSKINSGVDYA